MSVAANRAVQAPYVEDQIGSFERFSTQHPHLVKTAKAVAKVAITILGTGAFLLASIYLPLLGAALSLGLHFGPDILADTNLRRFSHRNFDQLDASLPEQNRRLHVLNVTRNICATAWDINRLRMIGLLAISAITGAWGIALIQTGLFFIFQVLNGPIKQGIQTSLSRRCHDVSIKIRQLNPPPNSDPFYRLLEDSMPEAIHGINQVNKHKFQMSLLKMIKHRDQNQAGFERLIRKIFEKIAEFNGANKRELAERQQRVERILNGMSVEESERLYRIYLGGRLPREPFEELFREDVPEIDFASIYSDECHHRRQIPVQGVQSHSFIQRHFLL